MPEREPFSLGFTERGRRVLLCIIIVGMLGIFMADLILVALSAVACVFMAYWYLDFRRSFAELRNSFSVQPVEVGAVLYADQVHRGQLKVSSLPRMSVSLGVDLLNFVFKPEAIRAGSEVVDYEFSSPLAGEYALEGLRLTALDGYGLFRGEQARGFGAAFRVYPRVYAVALEAVDFLMGSRGGGPDERASAWPGDGIDYAGTRAYVPGDPLRRLDWKAVARTGGLMVKTFCRESGGDVRIVYDPVAPDPVSVDELASAFLGAVLSFAGAGAAVGITVLGGGGVVHEEGSLDMTRVVISGLPLALGRVDPGLRGFLEVLDPVVRSRVETLFERELLRGFPVGAGTDVGKLVALDDCEHVVVVSCLAGNLQAVLKLSAAARARGGSVCLVQPTRPWKYAGDLSTAYEMWMHYQRLDAILRRENLTLVNDFEDIRLPTILAV